MTNRAALRVSDHPAAPAGLLERLPHRPPFHFITRVESFEHGVRGRAQWHVGGDEDFFRGHFPGRPVVPGVLIVEALAQLAGLVGLHAAGTASRGAEQVGGRLAHVEVRFDRSVLPPAVIDLHAMLQRSFGQLFLFDVEASSAGIMVARGTLTVAGVEP